MLWSPYMHLQEMYVPSQIKAGDEIFSPFVAAGWESAVEKNMRPAQWLGFLKIMTALGAEYVETGFFTPLVFSAKWKNVQLPQNYVWQAAAPAYAQVSAGTPQCTVSPTVGALALSNNSRTLSLSLRTGNAQSVVGSTLQRPSCRPARGRRWHALARRR